MSALVMLFLLPPQPCLELHLPLCPCISPYASADPKPTAKLRLSLWAQPSTHPPCSNISDTETYPWHPYGSEPCPGQLWPFWVLTGERRRFVSSWSTEALSSHWLFVPWGSSLSRLCMCILLSLLEGLFSFDERELGHLLSEPVCLWLKSRLPDTTIYKLHLLIVNVCGL